MTAVLDILTDTALVALINEAVEAVTLGILTQLKWISSLFNTEKREKKKKQHTMKGVVIQSYKGIQSVEVAYDLPLPKIYEDDDILIKVIAAGVDPIDLKICYGYGRVIRYHLRRFSKHASEEFPVILGRDCSGIVARTGKNVRSVSKGDAVWAIAPYCLEGLMAEYSVVKESQVSTMPSNLSFEEAASLPYVAVIAWNALVLQGNLGPKSCQNKRFLIHAGNTPIGLFAIQLIKAWGGQVTTTVPTAGLPMCHVLNIDDIVVYTVTDFEQELSKRKKYDIVLNLAGTALHRQCVNKCVSGGKVITLVRTPVLSDKFGFFVGSLLALLIQLYAWFRKMCYGATSQFWWNNFLFDNTILNTIRDLVEKNKIHPIVEDIYNTEAAANTIRQAATHNSVGRSILRINIY